MSFNNSFNKAIKVAKDIDGVRRSAFWHLGRRDHSEQELREKLARKTDNAQWIDTVISECINYDYVNDPRFIENFIRASQSKGFGFTRIKRDLQRKGIDTNALNDAVADEYYDYVTSAAALLRAKYSSALGRAHLKQKAIAFLRGKGHDFDDILQAIQIHNETLPEDEDDALTQAMSLLCSKFKIAIIEGKLQNKALRFLAARGYAFSDSVEAIKAHNRQINEEE